MIPWFTSPVLDLTDWGLGRIDAFVVLVGMAIVAGIWFWDRKGKRLPNFDRRVALRLPEVVLIGSFIGAHLVHVLFYHPELMDDDPWVLFKIWSGISSFGGFLGGTIAGVGLLKYYRLSVMPYGDVILFGLSVGWIFGRAGCTIAHDHPGARTDFFLGVAYPDGVRHDLGFYELLFTFVLVGILYLLTRKPWRNGTVVGTIAITYSPVRFGFDFLRATDTALVDARYLGLTPAQYGAVVLFGAGIALVVLGHRRNWPMQPPLFGEVPAVPAVEEST